jgi:hypothetical protein
MSANIIPAVAAFILARDAAAPGGIMTSESESSNTEFQEIFR